MPEKTAKNHDVTEKSTINHRTIVGQNRRTKTRTRIIEGALQVFAEKGPDAPVIDDFIQASGIARGTFYNYFDNTAELLSATSDWLADDVANAIEAEVSRIKNPVVRHGVAIRLFMKKAQSEPTWCRFIATIWFQKGFAIDGPMRDIQLGIDSGDLSCPSAECGWDLTFGTLRQVMIRLLKQPELIKTDYVDQIIDTILIGLGVTSTLRKEIFSYEWPKLRPTKTLARI